MRIIRDKDYVAERQKRAKLSAIFGFLALAGTFPVAFLMQGNSAVVAATYILLLGGFVLFNRGMRGVSTWSHNARHARQDMALDAHLDSLSERHTLIHYAGLEGGMVDHVMVVPGGVVVLTTTDFPGEAKCVNDRWQRGGPMLSRMFSFSGPQLGNPSVAADKEFAIVERTLEGAGHDVDIYTAIVFTASTADLEVDGCSHPVMPVDELSAFIRDIEADPEFSASERDEVIQLLGHTGEVETVVKTSTRRPVKVKKRAA
ncbi:MAG: hypothetical protein KF883_03535 [Thermomicrobiales bacterium]|nr:hypothetical protein [Thermomicrobiales bacterium]